MAENERTTGRAETSSASEVFEQELVELSHRRSEALRPEEDQDRQETRKNLVGLALSGGSLRAGAMSLGLMQAFYVRGLLRLIDYMSTVSGGGYAGAYLSSASLRMEHQSRSGEQDGENSGRAENDRFPIAPSATGQQPPRMLRFINSARHLNKPLTFFNRYTMGLILTWICIFSALLAASSLVTWTFRWLDLPICRDWLYAIGFDGDVKLAFFASFVLFVLWALCWAVSYFKFGSQATGACARVVFLLLVVMTMVAVASLFGTGDLDDLGTVLGEFGLRVDPKTMERFQTIFQAALFSVIGASLLPYLRPAKLLKSGTDAKTSFEKVTFWVATRALVFGVPFVFIAFFARENISQWNTYRDDRLTRNELRDFAPWSPMLRELGVIKKKEDDDKTNPPSAEEPLGLGGQMSAILTSVYVRASEEYSSALGRIWGTADPKSRDKASKAFEEYFKAEGKLAAASVHRVREWELRVQRPGQLSRELESYGMPDSRWPIEEESLSIPTRWYHLAEYLSSRLVRRENKENPVYQMAMSRRAAGRAKERVVAELNKRLEDPDFYKTMLPKGMLKDRQAVSDAFELVKAYHPTLDKETWREELKAQRVQLATFNWDLNVATETDEELVVLLDQQRRKIVSMNRKLLSAYYGDLIGDKNTVYAFNVLLADQRTRMRWFWWSLGVFIVAGLLVNMNATSWHGYHAQRIAEMWIEKVPGLGRRIPLAQLDTCGYGRPYHLINATATFLGRRQRPDESTLRDLFLFSKLYCGSDRTAYQRTAHYMHGEYTLDDAVVVSGGAVSPLFTTNPLVLILLLIFNIRMGQWVANPSARSFLPTRLSKLLSRWPVTVLRVLPSMLLPAERRPFCFVTDGGHYENLGLAPLLQRRCRLIFALDASHDDTYRFGDLFKVARWAQAKFGIRLRLLRDGKEETLNVDALIPKGLADSKPTGPEGEPIRLYGKDRYSEANYLLLKIQYPQDGDRPAEAGYIVYMKSAITGKEPFELLQYCERNSQFPHDSSANQYFDEDLFESYRHLGYFIAKSFGDRLPEELKRDQGEQLKTTSSRQFIRMLVGAFQGAEFAEDDAESERLIEQLRTAGDASEREQAASRLGNLEDPSERVVAALIDGLTDSDEFVAKICDLALRDYGGKILQQLRELGLQHQSDKNQAAVAGVIAGMIPDLQDIDPITIAALRRLMPHKRARVRKAAMAALQSYCVAFQDNPEHQETIGSIRAELAGERDSEEAAKAEGSPSD